MITLGIESSCDDTSVAVVKDGIDILSSIISSQIEIHKRFGGVVPEVASRKHLEAILPLLNQAIEKAGIALDDVDQIAVTAGPGLLGPLLIGLSTAKAIAWMTGKPLIPVNHIEAHLTAAFLSNGIAPKYPYLGLIVSGGHSNLVHVTEQGKYNILGYTIDDAPGELFDKISRFLGLGYPGGPAIQKMGESGDPDKYSLPRPMSGKGYLFSFSGLKTAAIRVAQAEGEKLDIPSLCASLQKAVAETFYNKTKLALKETKAKRLVLAGGVAANSVLRESFSHLAKKYRAELLLPSLHLCTDNAAMIAAHGHFANKQIQDIELASNSVSNWEMGKPLPDWDKK